MGSRVEKVNFLGRNITITSQSIQNKTPDKIQEQGASFSSGFDAGEFFIPAVDKDNQIYIWKFVLRSNDKELVDDFNTLYEGLKKYDFRIDDFLKNASYSEQKAYANVTSKYKDKVTREKLTKDEAEVFIKKFVPELIDKDTPVKVIGTASSEGPEELNKFLADIRGKGVASLLKMLGYSIDEVTSKVVPKTDNNMYARGFGIEFSREKENKSGGNELYAWAMQFLPYYLQKKEAKFIQAAPRFFTGPLGGYMQRTDFNSQVAVATSNNINAFSNVVSNAYATPEIALDRVLNLVETIKKDPNKLKMIETLVKSSQKSEKGELEKLKLYKTQLEILKLLNSLTKEESSSKKSDKSKEDNIILKFVKDLSIPKLDTSAKVNPIEAWNSLINRTRFNVTNNEKLKDLLLKNPDKIDELSQEISGRFFEKNYSILNENKLKKEELFEQIKSVIYETIGKKTAKND